MKNKLLLASAAVAVCAMLIIGGTLAYFTATTSEAVNTFTVGNIAASLAEPAWTSSGSAAAQAIAPGRVIAKDPVMTIAANSENCYVRLVVTMPEAVYVASNLASPAGSVLTFAGAPNSGWTQVGTTAIASGTAKIVYKYNTVVTKNAAAQPLTALYNTITVSAAATNDQLAALDGAGANFAINVKGYAIQTEGFATEALAFAAAGAFPAGTF